MDTTTLLIILLSIVLIILLVTFRGMFLKGEQEPVIIPRDSETDEKRVPCILCGSPLRRGENLKSEEYKREKESIVYIYGCHNCYGGGARKMRTCPVCKFGMPAGSYLIGRMWINKKGKRHLHVSGCTACSRLHKQKTTSF